MSLSAEYKIALARQLPPTFLTTENYGVKNYLKSVEIIKDHAVAVPGNIT